MLCASCGAEDDTWNEREVEVYLRHAYGPPERPERPERRETVESASKVAAVAGLATLSLVSCARMAQPTKGPRLYVRAGALATPNFRASPQIHAKGKARRQGLTRAEPSTATGRVSDPAGGTSY